MDPDVPVGLPLEYIINHCFLPPKLPQVSDTTPEVEVGLTKLLHDALISFIDLLPEDVQDEWLTLPRMLSILLDDGNLGSPIRNLDRKMDDMVQGGACSEFKTVCSFSLTSIRCAGSSYYPPECRACDSKATPTILV